MRTPSTKMCIFGGNANPALVKLVAGYRDRSPTKAEVKTFNDREIGVEIGENVRGVDCFIVQPTCTSYGRSVNDHLMELLIMIDALKRASAGTIVAIIPYFGYARQDRKTKPRTPISAKLVADLLTSAGATRVLAVDLHAGQIQGFFNIPFDHLFATPVFEPVLKKEGLCGEDLVVVSPDAGGTERARIYAKKLGATLAIIDKRREAPGVSKVMNLIGDVKGKKALIVDDIIDTAGTLCNAAAAVLEHGASEVHALATHGVFSSTAMDRINDSVLRQVWVTNSIPQEDRVAACSKLRIVDLSPLLAESITKIFKNDSLSDMFQ